jgi:hemoglobin
MDKNLMPVEPEPLFVRLGGREKLLILIRNFYASVREDAVLGPIFIQHIQDWPAHVETVADFWSVQTGGPRTYPGGFLGAHAQLGLQAAHLERWLTQWEKSCQLHFAKNEAGEMISLAHRLGSRMKTVLPLQPDPTI